MPVMNKHTDMVAQNNVSITALKSTVYKQGRWYFPKSGYI